MMNKECALTIGCFDGVHLGHQALLKRARECVGPLGTVVTITFSNHPAEFFSPGLSIPKLCTLEQKLSLLKQAGSDQIVVLEFTSSLAELSAKEFLKEHLPFSHLILGSGARFGKNNLGDETEVKKLQNELGFHVEYLPKTLYDRAPISSGRIRKFIQENQLSTAATLLDRPYPTRSAGLLTSHPL